MLVHTVACRLRRPRDPRAEERLRAALRSFAAAPPYAAGPARVLWDRGLRPGEERTADVLLEVPFADEAAFAAYLDDPRHRAFARDELAGACEGWLGLQVTRSPAEAGGS